MRRHLLKFLLLCVSLLLLGSCGNAPSGGESFGSSLEETYSQSTGTSSMADIELSADIPSDIVLEESTSTEESIDVGDLQVLSLDILQADVNAKQAFVYDTAVGCVFAKGDMAAKIYPASITKLYTAYVALQYLSPEIEITAGDEVDLVRSGSSLAYIRKGHTLTAEMLVQGMLLPSGNDAAYVLAAAAGRAILENDSATAREAVDAFMDTMNNHAASDGLTGTHFVTPDGFHEDDHYTTMKDLLKIASLVGGNRIIMKYAGMQSARVVYASGETNTWNNTNQLLNPASKYYRPQTVGLKTGHTAEAGYCLLTAERRGDRLILVGVFGCSYADGRFADTVKILSSLS